MGSLKLPHASGNSMSIAAPATNPSGDLELKLPATVGSANQLLKNSGTAGTLQFGGVPSMLATSTSYEGLELQTPSGDGSGEFHIGVHQSGSSAGRTIVFKRGGADGMDTESMRIDSSGNVGIGTSSPSGASGICLEINGGSGQSRLVFKNNTTGSASTDGQQIFSDGTTLGIQNREAGNITFETNGSERIRIHGTGDVMDVKTTGTGNSNYGMIVFRDGDNTYCGQITSNGSNHTTSYVTNSDYRLKQNEVSISDGITRLKQLKPYRFEWKTTSDKVDGFFAHEAQTVVPECIIGTKDEVDSDNKPVYQGIDQSKIVPLLTAALQEAITKIETLETKVAALEAA